MHLLRESSNGSINSSLVLCREFCILICSFCIFEPYLNFKNVFLLALTLLEMGSSTGGFLDACCTDPGASLPQSGSV